MGTRDGVSQGIKKDLFSQRPCLELGPLPRGFVWQIPSKERFAYRNIGITACKAYYFGCWFGM